MFIKTDWNIANRTSTALIQLSLIYFGILGYYVDAKVIMWIQNFAAKCQIFFSKYRDRQKKPKKTTAFLLSD